MCFFFKFKFYVFYDYKRDEGRREAMTGSLKEEDVL